MEGLVVDMRVGSFLPAGLKAKLKSWKGRVQSAYIDHFHSFTPDDLLEALRELGLEQGDVLIARTSFERFQGFQGGIGDHPVAGWGRKAPAILDKHQLARSPCGESSPFHRLLEANGRILLAGVGIRSMTFFHCLEEILQPRCRSPR
jgi:aminoglycoside N3'-acetyltransferase